MSPAPASSEASTVPWSDAGKDTMTDMAITDPPAGATVAGVVTVTVAAPSVRRVNFYIDGVLKGRDVTAPFSFDWYTTRYPDGAHSVKAVSGNGRFASEVTVTVKNAVPAPIGTVAISGKPLVGATLQAVVA